MSKWRPIETSVFGETFDVWWRRGEESWRIPNCHWRDEETLLDESGNIVSAKYVTHWMPLPEPPA